MALLFVFLLYPFLSILCFLVLFSTFIHRVYYTVQSLSHLYKLPESIFFFSVIVTVKLGRRKRQKNWYFSAIGIAEHPGRGFSLFAGRRVGSVWRGPATFSPIYWNSTVGALFLLSVVVKSCLSWKRHLPSSWSKNDGFASLMWHFNKLGVYL